MSAALVFRYQGYDAAGRKVEGEISAPTTEEAERRISARDIIITSMVSASRAHQEKPAATKGTRGGKPTRDGEAAAILRSLAVMLEAGVPFVEAVDGVAAGARPAEAARLADLKSEIIGGKSVSRAMRSVPELFQPMVADIVRVAEEGGRLDKALGSAASYLERADEFRKKVITAMLYPSMMIGVSIITLFILIVFVMPRFATIFTKMQVDLPFTTRVLMAAGNMARANPYLSAAIIVGSILGLRITWKLPAGRRFATTVLRRVPIVGDLMRRLAVSRAFSSVATLLGANVSMLAALEQGSRVAGDPLISEALIAARGSVERGATLFDSLSATGVVPMQFLQMIAVGERSGRLPSLLAAGAARMEEEMDARLKAAVALVEPLMIVIMGALVGTITVSVISPIYSVIENVK